MNKQLLYVMKNDFGLYKIGISKHPLKRVNEISNTSGVHTVIVEVFDTVGVDAKVVEKYLHNHFHNFRVKGEWFTEVNLSVIKDYIKNNCLSISCTFINECVKTFKCLQRYVGYDFDFKMTIGSLYGDLNLQIVDGITKEILLENKRVMGSIQEALAFYDDLRTNYGDIESIEVKVDAYNKERFKEKYDLALKIFNNGGI